jgi:two-component system, LytTR family, response regulator
MKRSAVIVDDEPQALQKLHRLLGAHEDQIQIVGQAADGLAAVEAIERFSPDVVFLDIEMPGLSGFGVLDSIPPEEWPAVVFTTAFEHYAIRAFEVHAVDYLLKPINRERLAECVARLDGTPPEAQRAQLDEARRQSRLERILVRRASKLVVIPVDEVAVFESENKLVFVRTAEGRFLLNMSMKEIEERVDPNLFCRVHKQAIVRLSLVREIHALAGGQYVAKLCDGHEVQVGRNYAHEFRSRFG